MLFAAFTVSFASAPPAVAAGITVLPTILPAVLSRLVSRVAELMPSGVLEAVELFFRRVPGSAELVTGSVPGIAMLLANVVPSGVPRVPGVTDMPTIPVHGMVPLRGQFTSLGGGGVASGGRQ